MLTKSLVKTAMYDDSGTITPFIYPFNPFVLDMQAFWNSSLLHRFDDPHPKQSLLGGPFYSWRSLTSRLFKGLVISANCVLRTSLNKYMPYFFSLSSALYSVSFACLTRLSRAPPKWGVLGGGNFQDIPSFSIRVWKTAPLSNFCFNGFLDRWSFVRR